MAYSIFNREILRVSTKTGSARSGKNAKLTLGIGVFDGVHLGHRLIMDKVLELSKATGSTPAAVTFDPHPRSVLRPHESPTLLCSLEERVRLLKEAGAKLVRVLPFTPEFARLEPKQFLDQLLCSAEFEVAGICVGEHWHFGRNGMGDSQGLAKYAAMHNIGFCGCPELELNGEIVSSSAIRRAIASGKLNLASAMLGRVYRLIGTVEHGYSVGGKELSRPTANLAFSAGVLPPDGIYAAKAYCQDKAYPAAVNIGFAPTFHREHAKRRVEVHLLDFAGNLYDSELGVEFLQFLREERTFADPAALKAQINQDIIQIRRFFEER
ncbi:MAG: riboflavin biosynthesis protein RibF [Victivallales bacterium]|jgi:riboflavin kinase/FMN adenylyltransferase|nr:riboflavin biosynthesis protein RibF [Victivallales bacterium]